MAPIAEQSLPIHDVPEAVHSIMGWALLSLFTCLFPVPFMMCAVRRKLNTLALVAGIFTVSAIYMFRIGTDDSGTFIVSCICVFGAAWCLVCYVTACCCRAPE